MVLTERQRSDLHAGIHEYLLAYAKSSKNSAFEEAAKAMHKADPEACERNTKGKNGGSSPSKVASVSTSIAPLLEKKWTAVPRLQKKVLELERALSSAGVGAGNNPANLTSPAAMVRTAERRYLPRPPAVLTLTGHTSIITSVSLHPSFSLAASGSEDGTIKLWDVESGDLMKTLRGHTNTVTCVSFDDSSSASSCRMLASTSTDLSIKLWAWREGSAISEWTCTKTLRGHDHTISSVAFIPNKNPASTGGLYVVSASRDASIRLWEVATGFCLHTFTGHTDWVRCLDVSRVTPTQYVNSSSNTAPTSENDVILASGSNDSSIRLWALRGVAGIDGVGVNSSQQPSESFGELRGHEHVVEAVSFVLPSGGTTGNSSAASASAKRALSTITNKAGHDVSTLLVSGSRDKSVRLWNVSTQDCLMVFEAHENWVQTVLLHPSGNYIVSGGDDRSIRVLDIKSHRCLRTIDNAHAHFVSSIAMHRSLPILVSASVDQTLKCWSLD